MAIKRCSNGGNWERKMKCLFASTPFVVAKLKFIGTKLKFIGAKLAI